MAGERPLDPEYVAARRVLLDALEALGAHRKAVVLHKIAERKDTLDRLQDKDGLDVLRLFRFADTAYLADRLAKLAAHPVAGDVTRKAREFLHSHFGDRDGIGAQMAVRASVGLEDAAEISASCKVLARRLLDAWMEQ